MIRLLLSVYRNRLRGRGQDSGRVVMVFLCLLAYSTTGYMYFELPSNPSLEWLDAFWWSIVTMTTVGYGDLFPTTVAGRVLIGFPTMLIGIAVLGYFLSLIATKLVEAKLKETRGMNAITDEDHIILCNYKGLDATQEVITELRRDDSTHEILIVLVDNELDELPAELGRQRVRFVRGEPARESVLNQAGLEDARAVIICAKHNDPETCDNYNLRIGLTIESLRPAVHTVVECLNGENIPFFERAGCDSVVCLSALSGCMVVQELQDPGLADIFGELASNQTGKQFYLVPMPKTGGRFDALRQQLEADGVVAIGIRRDGQNHLLPADDFIGRTGDLIISIANDRPVLA